MGEGDEDASLRNATINSLRLADEHHLASLTFPAISTGIFGYPLERCSRIMLQSVRDYCEKATSILEIRFCLFDQEALDEFRNAAESVFTR